MLHLDTSYCAHILNTPTSLYTPTYDSIDICFNWNCFLSVAIIICCWTIFLFILVHFSSMIYFQRFLVTKRIVFSLFPADYSILLWRTAYRSQVSRQLFDPLLLRFYPIFSANPISSFSFHTPHPPAFSYFIQCIRVSTKKTLKRSGNQSDDTLLMVQNIKGKIVQKTMKYIRKSCGT